MSGASGQSASGPCPHCGQSHPEEVLVCPVTKKRMPLAGRLLARKFRFLKMLGEGGMSVVWMAENELVAKRVAIKIMHPEFASNPKTLGRFRNEATAAGKIGNAHICDILDFGESELGPFIVMEMLQGQSFGDLLDKHGKIPHEMAATIVRQANIGLEAAHRANIVHRDLKPENIFLHEPEPGRLLVKLMDFGISKFGEAAAGSGKTGANVLMGTPEYMSPEQAEGAANADARTDVWAMGAMLYRAVTGVDPFGGTTLAAVLLAVTTKDPPPVRQYAPEVPEDLAAAIERCLIKDVNRRTQSAAELSAALDPYAIADGDEAAVALAAIGRAGGAALSGGTQIVSPGAAPAVPVPTGAGSAPASMAAPAAMAAPAVVSMPPAGGGEGSSPPPAGTWSNEGLASGAPGGGQTWSTELSGAPDEDKWTLHEGEGFDDRPDRISRRRRGGAGLFIVLGILLVGALGGGAYVVFGTDLLKGKAVASGDDEGVETGTDDGDGEESGADEAGGGDTGGPAPKTDLPPAAADSGAETGAPADTDTGAAADSGGTPDPTPDPKPDPTPDPKPDPTPDPKPDPTPDPKPDPTPDPTPSTKVDTSKVYKVGSKYTPREAGPNGSWNAAKSYCAKLKKQKFAGLRKWRMASASEVKSFKSKPISKLRYWTSSSSGDQAQTISAMSGSTKDISKSMNARPFCVSTK